MSLPKWSLVCVLCGVVGCREAPGDGGTGGGTGGGGSGGGAGDAGVLKAPTAPNTVAASLKTGAVHLTWVNTGSDQTELVIGRAIVLAAAAKPAQTELVIIGSATASATSFDDRDIELGHFYVYGVAARGPGGRSAFTVQTGDALSLNPPGSPCQKAITATDADGDGLSDADEKLGWTVLINEDGKAAMSMRLVQSDPFSADTDSDGLCDNEESALKTDPRQLDSDGDGLADYDEVNRWGSSPTNVDSDQDAQGNSSFYDGSEVLNFGTSPTLADSDGDGRTDFEEINQNGTNALVAEIPMPALTITSAMDLGVNVKLENGSTVSNAATHAFEQGTSTALSKTSETANTQTTESSYSIEATVSAGFPESASVEATGTYSNKSGYVQETSSSFSRASTASSQSTYEALTSDAVNKNETISGGHIGLNFAIQNQGTRSFQMSSVVVTALKRDPANPASFTSIATLAFPSTADAVVLAEGQSTGPIRAEADISASAAIDLLSNPSAVFFKAANFALTDRTGTAFQFSIGEETSNRTALLTIDYGGVRPLERFRIATNVERTSTGKAAGVRLGDALSKIIGLTPGVGYQTEARFGGTNRIMTRVRDVEATPSLDGGTERFWVVIAPENPDPSLTPVAQRLLSRTSNLEDAVLMPRDSLTLAFVADGDHDGLFEREELMYGTYDGTPDSDGDGLTDFEEVRQGWVVPVDNAFYSAHPKVYSRPTSVDADGDGWSDAVERTNGTDPNRRDTDGDGLIDSLDPAPTKGPTGAWVKVLGTSGDDAVLQVLPTTDTVWVLGTSTGDFDGDGTAGGPFLMALEPDTGAKRWAVQLEGTTNFTKKITVDASNNVTWVAEVYPSVVQGATAHAIHLLRFSRTGAVLTVTDQTNVPYVGATSLSGNVCATLEPSENGSSTFFSSHKLFNGQNSYAVTTFDVTGAYGGSVSIGGSNTEFYTYTDTATLGVLTVASLDWVSGCSLTFFRGVKSPGSIIKYCGAGFSGRVKKVGLDSQSAAYASVDTGSKDRLDRLTLAGAQVWSRDFSPDFTAPRVTSLDIDAADQLFIGIQDSGKPATVEIVDVHNVRRDLFTLGNASTRVNSSRRDTIGNVFMGSTTTGGFEIYGPSLGGTDVVITRNPQITFGL